MTPQYIKIDEFGSKFYFKDKAMRILHREDGPAFEYTSGHKEWYLNGKRHREDGPAIEYDNGYEEWWLNGTFCSEQEFLLKTAKEVVLTMDEIAAKFGVDVSKLKITGTPLI
jgi:hypothetical protein